MSLKKLADRLSALWRPQKTTPPSQPAPPPASPEPAVAATAPVSTFQPLNELERMLMAAATDPSRRAEFQRAMLEADLFAATPEAPLEEGYRTLEAGENIKLLSVPGPDGRPVTALFTSPDRIAEVFGPGHGFLGIRGETVLDIVSKTGAFLNPGLAYGVHWGPEAIAGLLGRPITRTIAQETKVMLGTPAEPPTELIAELRAALGSDPRISEAWLALAKWPETDEMSWYLSVRTDLGIEQVREMLAATFKRGNFAGRPLDMVLERPDAKPGIGIRVAPATVN